MTSLACLRFRIPPLRLDDFDAFWSSLTSVTYVMLQKNFAIQVTRCNLLAVLTGTGETALFTFSRLIPVSKLLRVTLEDFISNVSDHISVTWDVQIDPDKLDLRWHDSSGDTFVLRNTNLLGTYFICIDLNGVDIRTRAICFLPDLSLISTSCASCALSCHRALPAGYLPYGMFDRL